jgi:hypothetical protein
MNGLTTSFIASRSLRSCDPQTWITTGAPGLATRPAARTAATKSFAKEKRPLPSTSSAWARRACSSSGVYHRDASGRQLDRKGSPSTRRQMSATAPALSSVSSKRLIAFCCRATDWPAQATNRRLCGNHHTFRPGRILGLPSNSRIEKRKKDSGPRRPTGPGEETRDGSEKHPGQRWAAGGGRR